ncbi:MAG TPA: response regulator transcription factor [Herpetosiphonaceae bacterium]
MTRLSVVLADDHDVVRHGLRTLLETQLSCHVVGEAADGRATVDLVRQQTPDVLVVDMMMPGLTGLEVTRRVRQLVPHTRIVVLSMHADESYIREALRAGATAYVLKESKAAEIVQAVRDAAQGQRYLSPGVSERIIASYLQHYPATDDPYELLTDRERDVLHLAARGLTAAEIAEQLTVGVRTVESYRTSLMRKLDLRHQTDLVLYAIKRGIISLPF